MKIKLTKILYLIIFSGCFFLSTGWTWQDAKSEYGDILNQSPVCEYAFNEKNLQQNQSNEDRKKYINMDRLIINLDLEALKVKITKSSEEKDNNYYNMNFSNPKMTPYISTSDNWMYYFSDIEEFLANYKKNDGCPEQIFASFNPNLLDSRSTTINLNFSYFWSYSYEYVYDLVNNNTGNPNTPNNPNTPDTPSVPVAKNDSKPCAIPDALECYHYTKNNVPKSSNVPGGGNTLYIEVAKLQNGDIKFGVDYNSLFTNSIFGYYSETIFYNKNNVYANKVYGDLFFFNVNLDNKDGKTLYDDLGKNGATLSLKCDTEYRKSGAEWPDGKYAYELNLGGSDNYNKCLEASGVGSQGSGTQEPTQDPHPPRLDYTSICSTNDGVRSAAKIIGYVLSIGKWIVAFIIIIFGIIDFSKAVISSDEKAISKAASKLLKRFIAGVVAIVIPILPIALLNLIRVSQGIEDSSNFAACTKCIFDPFNSCN